MIDSLLSEYLEHKIAPNPEIINQALDSQERLKQVLENKLEDDSSLPYLLSGHDFLFGSAIRNTKPSPFDDIDLMLVLDGSNLIAVENGQNMGSAHGARRPVNPLTDFQYLDENGHISSIKVMNKIKNSIGEAYSRSEIKKDGQAINVWMESYGFGIDIVPAFKIDHKLHGTHYFIPAGNSSHEWQSTNPHIDIETFKQEDYRTGSLLTNTAKLMRKWNELSNSNRLSGFHIDALVYRSLYGSGVGTLVNAVLTCLSNFDSLLTTHCPQFSGFNPHIDHKLSNENRSASQQALRRSKTVIDNANLNALLGIKDERSNVWNSLFGGQLL